jgi:hypothetical protein
MTDDWLKEMANNMIQCLPLVLAPLVDMGCEKKYIVYPLGLSFKIFTKI